MSRYALLFFVILMGTLQGVCFNALADNTLTRPPGSFPRPHRIKIANIGTLPPAVASDATPEQIVQRVKGFWQSRFARFFRIVLISSCCLRTATVLSTSRLSVSLPTTLFVVIKYATTLQRWPKKIIATSLIPPFVNSTMEHGGIRSCCWIAKAKLQAPYDKNHPTIGEIEQGKLPGTKVPIIECDFGRVAAVICFDLNFDRLREQVKAAKPDLILFSSNYHGGLMQGYWAYSCRSHFVGSIRRIAPSEIRNPLGNVIATNTDYFDYAVADVNLDCELVHLDSIKAGSN